MKNRDNALDILKGIGILTMVMGHSNMGETFTIYIAGFHMQLFFGVSGFLFNPTKYSFHDFVSRKAKTLLIPYITFAVLTIIVCFFVSISLRENIYDFPKSLLGIIYSNRSIFPITGAIWFLQCLFVVEVAFWMISKLPIIYQIFSVFVIFIFGYIQGKSGLWLPFTFDSALSALVFFYCGYLLQNVKHNVPKYKIQTLTLGIVFIVISLVTIFYNGPVNPRICEFGNYSLYYLNAILATMGWYFISKFIDDIKFGNFIASIGRDSIVFVGLNQLIITALYHSAGCIISFDNMVFRGIRNVLICLITILLLKWLSDLITRSKLRVFLGK